MQDFTPWTLFVDAGLISLLLLVGKLIRVKVRIIQRLFIPTSLIAGLLGLALGPNGCGLVPLSGNTGTYASILIALIFGCLPLTSQRVKGDGATTGSIWAYSQAGMLLQWALGGLLGVVLLGALWPLCPGFGIAMPAGFCGGHGTAAAIGLSFQNLGYDEVLSLAMTAATFGILASVILGLGVIKWGTRRGHATFLADYDSLPHELRTGLLPESRRESMGTAKMSSMSIDSLTFNIITVSAVALGGYGLNQLAKLWLTGFELPVFSCAFIAGLVVKRVFDHTRVSEYLCPQMVGHISGMFTDLLVAFGIASIKLTVVVEYLAPLSILLLSGLFCTLAYVLIMGRKLLRDYWFEKAIFTWGWFMGTMAMGIAMLRVVDPGQRSRTMDNYALAYLFIAPVEISLVTFAPAVFCAGYGLLFALACLALGLAVLGVAYLKGWTAARKKLSATSD